MRDHYRSLFLVMLFLLCHSLSLTVYGQQAQYALPRDLQAAAELLEAEDYREAQRVLEPWLAANATADEEAISTATVLLGLCHELQGDREQAEPLYRRLIAQHTSTHGALLAQFRLDMTQFGLIDETPEVISTLAVAYESAHLFSYALKTMEQLFEQFPDAKNDARYLIQYGDYLNQMGVYETALALFDEALRGDLDHFWRMRASLGQGISYRHMGRVFEATRALRAADAAARVVAVTLGDQGHLEMIQQVLKGVKAPETAFPSSHIHFICFLEQVSVPLPEALITAAITDIRNGTAPKRYSEQYFTAQRHPSKPWRTFVEYWQSPGRKFRWQRPVDHGLHVRLSDGIRLYSGLVGTKLGVLRSLMSKKEQYKTTVRKYHFSDSHSQ